MSELNRKRKHSIRVSEIIKCKESRLLMTNAFQKMETQEVRPLTNADPRLNEHKVRKRRTENTEPPTLFERLYSQ